MNRLSVHPMQRRYADLFATLGDGATVVTASRRLARTLQLAYAEWCAGQGHTLWATPAIMTAEAWFGALWQTCSDLTLSGVAGMSWRRTLTLRQERALWERIIVDSSHAHPMLRATAAAELAQEAWRLSHQWDLLPATWRDHASDDHRAYAAWAHRFEAQLRALTAVTQAELPSLLHAQVEQLSAHVSQRVWWAGWERLPPQWQVFADALAAHGIAIAHHESHVTAAPVTRTRWSNPREELYAAARWARACVERDPHSSVAVVVTDLETRRHDVARIFAEVLAPHEADAERPGAGIYNISLGAPLLQAPMIQDAMLVLEAVTGSLPAPSFGRLLLSPYCGHQPNVNQELACRALWDRYLRERGEAQVSIPEACALLPPQAPVAAFAVDMAALAQMKSHIQGVKYWREWIAVIDAALKCVGWPGARTVSSAEQQLHAAWITVLEQLTEFDAVLPPAKFSEVVTQLQRLATEHIFQPESPPAAVQVLGMAQAAGLCFDHMWVGGCHDEALPLPPRPSPLLPARAQRQQLVLGASSAASLQTAHHLISAWRVSAQYVTFSYAERDQDKLLHMSPLLAALDAADSSDLNYSTAPLWAEQLRVQPITEPRANKDAPVAVTAVEVAGGVNLFKDQSACPFRAFVRYRLSARALRPYRTGWEARDRGSIAHDALRVVWDDIRDSDRLHALNEDALLICAQRAARQAVQSAAEQRPQWFTPHFTLLETQRLARNLMLWLNAEKARSPFRILALESSHVFTIGGLTVRGRIDRMDRLLDGSVVIMDYKTGNANRAHWFGQRLEEPQLPLYAVAASTPVSALLYVKVNAAALEFSGLAEGDGWGRKVCSFDTSKYSHNGSHTWLSQIEEWRANLTALAAEFSAGHHVMAPRDGYKTCQQCDQHMLCRIHEHVACNVMSDDLLQEGRDDESP